VVVADVDGAQVPGRENSQSVTAETGRRNVEQGDGPVLIDEKVDDVERVQDVDDDHRVADESVELVLVRGKREIAVPCPCQPSPYKTTRSAAARCRVVFADNPGNTNMHPGENKKMTIKIKQTTTE